MFTPNRSLAKLTAMGLAAMEVRNTAEITTSHWNTTGTRKFPSLFSVPSLGSEPKVVFRDWTMGARMPPARAVLLGMAGAITRSLAMSE